MVVNILQEDKITVIFHISLAEYPLKIGNSHVFRHLSDVIGQAGSAAPQSRTVPRSAPVPTSGPVPGPRSAPVPASVPGLRSPAPTWSTAARPRPSVLGRTVCGLGGRRREAAAFQLKGVCISQHVPCTVLGCSPSMECTWGVVGGEREQLRAGLLTQARECSIRIRNTADMVGARDLKRWDKEEIHEPDLLAQASR